eukprot:5584003-Amphidinium_carterae.1
MLEVVIMFGSKPALVQELATASGFSQAVGRYPGTLCLFSKRMATWASTRAWSINVLASAVMPLMAAPMWESISKIFSILLGSSSCDVTLHCHSCKQRKSTT